MNDDTFFVKATEGFVLSVITGTVHALLFCLYFKAVLLFVKSLILVC